VSKVKPSPFIDLTMTSELTNRGTSSKVLLVLTELESEPHHVLLSSLKSDPEFDMAGWDGKPVPFKPHHDPEKAQAIDNFSGKCVVDE
jgi:hypothetical protein